MAEGFSSSGNKRNYNGAHGSKDDIDGALYDPARAARELMDPPVRADAEMLKSRRIAAPRSRRGASGLSSRDSSIDRQLGNPFAQVTPPPQTNGSAFTAFGQQSSTPVFGSNASQSFPPANNAFASSQQTSQPFTFGAPSQTSSSFPPAPNASSQQPSFGNSTTNGFGTSNPSGDFPPAPPAQSGAFTFGNSTGKNPFSFASSNFPAQPSQPAPNGNTLTLFGQSSQQQSSSSAQQGENANTTSSSSAATPTAGNASGGFKFNAVAGSTSNLFGSKNNSTAAPSVAQNTAPQTSNVFGQSQTPQSGAGLFATKPTTNTPIFGASKQSTTASSTPAFGANNAPAVFGTAAHIDDMMTSPPVSPQKQPGPSKESSNSVATTFATAKSSTSPSKPDNPFAKVATPTSTPSASTSLFQAKPQVAPPQTAQLPTPSDQSPPKAPTSSLFTPKALNFDASPASKTPTTGAPQFKPAARRPPKPAFLFASSTREPAREPSAAIPTPKKQDSKPTPHSRFSLDSLSAEQDLAEAQGHFRKLNQSFKTQLMALKEEDDWTAVVESYIGHVESMKASYAAKPGTKRPVSLAAEEREPKRTRAAAPEPRATEPTPAPTSTPVPATPPAAPVPANFVASTTPTSSPNKSQTANLFASIVESPSEQSVPRPADKSNVPALPAATPSQASNMFAASAAKSTASAKPVQTETPNPFANISKGPSPAPFLKNSSKQASPPKRALEPDSSSTASMPSLKMPKFSASAGGNAFAAFASQAEKSKEDAEKEAEKKELEKRFDADYDSDEEDERTFNKRVLAEIRAERAKAKKEKSASASQATFDPVKGFSFSSAGSTSEKAGESQETPPSSAEAAPATPKPAPSLFSPAPSTAVGGTSIFATAVKPSASGLGQPASTFTPAPATAVGGRSIFETAVKPQSTSGNLFGHLATPPQQSEDDDSSGDEHQSTAPSLADSTMPGGGKSLFERISKDSASEQTSSEEPSDKEPGMNGATPKANPFASSTLFGKPTPIAAGASDHTWKNDSPIKFGGIADSATPTKVNGSADSTTPVSKSFTNIFGAAKPNSTPNLFAQSASKPGVGFSFGASANGNGTPTSQSPSSTREGSAITTADEAGTAKSGESINLDGAPAETQLSLSDLTEEERRSNDVLFEVGNARVQQYDNLTKGWDRRGNGPLRVLKHKETGVVQVLGRSDPQGKILLNTTLLQGMSYESPAKGRVKFPAVVAGGKITTILVTVKEDEVAKELAKVMRDNKPE